MGTFEFILAIVSLVATGGWFVAYRSYKRKASAEADKSEAEVVQLEVDGWKAQQDVYQQTIEDLKQTCAYIREDRNLLREENKKLRDENDALRDKYNEMEKQIIELRKEMARQGRRLESVLPFTCGVVACTNRTRVEFQEQNENEEQKPCN